MIEIIVAVGVMVIGISASAAVMLVVERMAEEMTRETQAISIAEEGIQAAISIGDRSWTELSVGNHGLAIGGTPIAWILNGASDTANGFTRVVSVSSVDIDTKKIDVTVTWVPSAGRSSTVREQMLVTDWASL